MIRDLYRTVVTGGAVLGLTGAYGPIITAVASRDSRRADPWLKSYCLNLLKAAAVQHEAVGLENLPDEPCIFACNHQSHFDGLLIYGHLDKHIRFVAKRELFKIPLFGMAIRAIGTIEVDRTGSDKDRQAMTNAVDAIHRGVSVMFFPEGTRSEDGVLKPFKKGAAMLAIQAQAPIVPLGVAGTKEILPKGSRWIRGGRRAVICVGRPIATKGKTVEDRDAVTQQAAEAVATLVAHGERLIVPSS